MKIKEVLSFIEEMAPVRFQESFDNSGVQVGDVEIEAQGALICLDVTESIVDEAIENNCNIIICHHPLIFGGLKSITGKNAIERIVIKTIQNNLCIYAAHTNMDVVPGGVNFRIAEILGLKNVQILAPTNTDLLKLAVFVPVAHKDKVEKTLFEAGAGEVGKYDSCSFQVNGEGSFRANEGANPFVGEKGKIHFEKEVRIETILPAHLKSTIINKMLKAHPYEEVAYDIYKLENKNTKYGLGLVGDLPESIDEMEFLKLLKTKFHANGIRYTNLLDRKVNKVALCGGSGSSFLDLAKAKGADVFVTGDFKYHQFFEAENQILIADIGHYESEQFTKDIFYEILKKKLPKFAIRLSEINSNPINYL